MIGGAALLLMQHLMSSSGPSSYYRSSASTIQTKNQLQPNETVMFIELNELHLDGSTDVKRINAAYIKYMETTKFFLTDMETYKTTKDYVDATRITMFDDSKLFVADSMHDMGFRLQVV